MNSRFDELETSLKCEAAELLESQQKRHPTTDSRYFIDCVQKNRQDQLQKFVDAFGNLAIEKCLLEPMSLIFPSQTTEKSLDDSVLSNIAAENQSSRHTTEVTIAAP